MLANSNSTAATMKQALAYTATALISASELDLDRSDEDRAFFASKKESIEQLLDRLMEAINVYDAHSLKEGLKQQIRVNLGDAVLDRAVSGSKALMKALLREKSPDSADFVFGNDITKLIRAELRSQPYLVLECLNRLASVPEFDGKKAIAEDLDNRAKRQIANLQERDAGRVKRSELSVKLNSVVGEGANALYHLQHELFLRFPRDREYVNQFFLNVSPKRKKEDEETEEEPPK